MTSSLNKQQGFLVKVYGWMFLAMLISGTTAYFAFSSLNIIEIFRESKFYFYGLLGLELLLVIVLSAAINNLSPFVAKILFILYSVITGLTLSIFFYIFTTDSMFQVFLMTGALFGIMSIFGYITKIDLSGIGSWAIVTILWLTVAHFSLTFIYKQPVPMYQTLLGVLAFLVLTAYDTQRIKKMSYKSPIIGALSFYLNYLNIFLKLLRIFGKRK